MIVTAVGTHDIVEAAIEQSGCSHDCVTGIQFDDRWIKCRHNGDLLVISRIVSWNRLGELFTDWLVRAHPKGVLVQDFGEFV